MIDIEVLEGNYYICKLDKMPVLQDITGFFTLSVTQEEISLVCLEKHAPVSGKIQKDYGIIFIKGELDFSLKGILAQISNALKQISIFAISTYNTDYILVKQKDMPKALKLLENLSLN